MEGYTFSVEEQRSHPSSSLFFNVVDVFTDPYICKYRFLWYIAMYRTNVYRITIKNEDTGLMQEYLRWDGSQLVRNELFSKSNIDRKELDI